MNARRLIFTGTLVLLLAGFLGGFIVRQQATDAASPNSQASVTQSPVLPIPTNNQTAAAGNIATPIKRPVLSTVSPNGHYQTGHDHDHHKPFSATNDELPAEIQAYIESQRIERSTMISRKEPNGVITLELNGQYETVSIATIDADGNIVITERQIQPLDNKQN